MFASSIAPVLRRVWLPGLHSSILLRARPVIIIMPDSTRMQITFSVSHFTLELSKGLREVSQCPRKAPTKAFSLLTTIFTIRKRHYILGINSAQFWPKKVEGDQITSVKQHFESVAQHFESVTKQLKQHFEWLAQHFEQHFERDLQHFQQHFESVAQHFMQHFESVAQHFMQCNTFI